MRRISLGERLILFYVLVSVLAVAIVGRLSYDIARNALMERTFDQLTSVKMLKKKHVEDFFRDRSRDIERVSESVNVLSVMKNGRFMDDAGIRTFLRNFMKANSNFDNIYLWDHSGHCLFIASTVDNILDQNSDKQVSSPVFSNITSELREHQVYIHDFAAINSGNRPVLLVCQEITCQDHSLCGYIGAGISIPAIDAIMLENDPSRGLGITGESYLVGKDYLLRSDSRFSGFRLLKSKVVTEGVEKAFSEGDGTGTYKDYRGISVLGSFGKVSIPGLDWAIIAEIDVSEAFIPVNRLRNNILLLSTMISVIVFIIAMILSRKITNPILRLKKAVSMIGGGVYEPVSVPRSNDEISELAVAFNQMAVELRYQKEELAEERLKRFSAMIDGQDLERQRLSMELHDGLGQSLVALRMKLESLTGIEKGPWKNTLEEVTTGFDLTIDEIRRISNDLMPAVLNAFGLPAALRYLCNEAGKSSKLMVNVAVQDITYKLEAKEQTYLFRIAQEALNNVVKHAEAKTLTFHFEEEVQYLLLEITDDGKGMSQKTDQADSGSGLYNIRERVLLLSGELNITTGPGRGTRITVRIPKKKTIDG